MIYIFTHICRSAQMQIYQQIPICTRCRYRYIKVYAVYFEYVECMCRVLGKLAGHKVTCVCVCMYCVQQLPFVATRVHATETHSTNMPLATLNGFGCKNTYYTRTHMHATRSTGYKWLLLTANGR